MPLKFNNGIDLNGQRAQGAADPSVGTDLVTKQWAENLLAGLSWKGEVRVATTANGTLATAFANGQTIDGIVLATGDRILLKNQTTQSENGIRVVAASGAPARATDADSTGDLNNATVSVTEGTVNGGLSFTQTTKNPVVDTSNIVWAQFNAGQTYSADGQGLELSGGVFSLELDGSSLTKGSNGLKVTADLTTFAKKAAGNIGNGSATTIDFAHNLNTTDITVTVRLNSTGAQEMVENLPLDANTVRLGPWPAAPASNAYRCIVQG